MEFKYIDIHSHLNLDKLAADQAGVLARMSDAGVGSITIGVDYDTSLQAVELAGQHDLLWAGVGMHPTDNTDEVFNFDKYKQLAEHDRVVCIGECGLDYYRSQDDAMKVRQKELFLEQIRLAATVDKPLMIHARPSQGSMDAYHDALDILEESKKQYPNLRANFHFFIGDVGVARRALGLGFTMSFDGPITFARDYDEVIKFLPIESIMAETDAPFAAPVPYRGQTCEPYMVAEIANKIAEVKNLDPESTRIQLLENSMKFFNLSNN